MKIFRDNPVWTSLAAGAVTLTSIIGGFNALGIDPIPWATASDIDKVEKAAENRDIEIMKLIKQMQDEFKDIRHDQVALMQEFWQKRLDEANEDLAANPSSRTAKTQKVEAERQLEELTKMLEGSPHP